MIQTFLDITIPALILTYLMAVVGHYANHRQGYFTNIARMYILIPLAVISACVVACILAAIFIL